MLYSRRTLNLDMRDPECLNMFRHRSIRGIRPVIVGFPGGDRGDVCVILFDAANMSTS